MQLTVMSNHIHFPHARDAFETTTFWLTAPELAYSSWISKQAYRDSTKTVYISMFKKMLRWLDDNGIAFHRCDKFHIGAFLDQEKIHKGHRYRYIRMTERVFDHLQAIGAISRISINPGRQAAILKMGNGQNDPTHFFSMYQMQSIIATIQKNGEAKIDVSNWIMARDQALISVILGGGAKVSQLKRMTVNCMNMPGGWLRKEDGRHPHRAKLPPWAVDSLQRWLEVRAALKVPGNALFPATVTGRGKLAGQPMHPASIFRRINAFLAAVDLGNPATDSTARRCAQTLRNTYAAALFEEGAPDELVTEYLGLQTVLSAQRLRTAWKLSCNQSNPSSSEGTQKEHHGH